MDITELRTETAEWDAFVRASGEGSPFQLVAWKRAVERTFGLRAHYLMARENGRLAGVLPLFEARELFGRRALISVPYAVYGGICATSDAPRRLFHALAEAFEEDCHVLAVYHDERIVAGVLSFFYEDQVLPYYGGAIREAFAYAVNDFMYWELMCLAAKAGMRVFDFGRSREGTGSYDFKRHWGFEPVPLPYQYVLLNGHELPDVSPSNPKLRRATDLWKRLPLYVTNRLGPMITRYLP